MRSPDQHARDLADTVLAATDWLLDNRAGAFDSEAVSHLIALRVRARDVLAHIPRMTPEQERAAALRAERWGALGVQRNSRDS